MSTGWGIGSDLRNASYRAPIAVVGSGSATYADIYMPAGWGRLFDNIQDQTTAHDTYPATPAMQQTIFDRTWDATNETLRLRVDYSTTYGGADTIECWWLYWGRTSPSDSTGSPTTTTPTYGWPVVGRAEGEPVITAYAVEPGVATPLDRVAKTSTETKMVWFDLTPLLGLSDETQFDRTTSLRYVRNLSFNASTGSGVYAASSRQAAMSDTDGTRFVEENGRLLAGIKITGGSSGTDYTIRCIGTVTEFRYDGSPTSGESYPFDVRALLQVLDPVE